MPFTIFICAIELNSQLNWINRSHRLDGLIHLVALNQFIHPKILNRISYLQTNFFEYWVELLAWNWVDVWSDEPITSQLNTFIVSKCCISEMICLKWAIIKPKWQFPKWIYPIGKVVKNLPFLAFALILLFLCSDYILTMTWLIWQISFHMIIISKHLMSKICHWGLCKW